MQDDGILPAKADPDALATGLMAALQGGYLLAQADHDVAPMATALDMALAHIESLDQPHENRQATQDGHFLTPCGRHPAAPQDRRQTLNRADTIARLRHSADSTVGSTSHAGLLYQAGGHDHPRCDE